MREFLTAATCDCSRNASASFGPSSPAHTSGGVPSPSCCRQRVRHQALGHVLEFLDGFIGPVGLYQRISIPDPCKHGTLVCIHRLLEPFQRSAQVALFQQAHAHQGRYSRLHFRLGRFHEPIEQLVQLFPVPGAVEIRGEDVRSRNFDNGLRRPFNEGVQPGRFQDFHEPPVPCTAAPGGRWPPA